MEALTVGGFFARFAWSPTPAPTAGAVDRDGPMSWLVLGNMFVKRAMDLVC